MTKVLIFLLATLSLSAQYTRKTICASGCDYANSSTGLQSAVNDAATAQGITCAPYLIEIDPSNVLDLFANSVTLPAKTCAQYVRIRSMQMASLPSDGTRVDTTSSSLARIQSTGNAQYFNFFRGPVAKTRYWAFEGLNLYGNSTNGEYGAILQLAETDSNFPASTDPGLRMDHIEVKHCWIHGVIGRLNVSNGIGIGANSVLIADSVLEDIANTGEAHAIAINWSDGPIDLINNTLDAATIVTIVGGTIDPAGLIPSFVRYIGNQYRKKGWYKNLTGSVDPAYPCRPGNVHHTSSTNHDWTCSGAAPGTWTDTGVTTGAWQQGAAAKNIWEHKTGRGIRVFGNDFSGGTFPSGQGAEVFVLNLVSSTYGGSPPPWVFPAGPNGGTTYAQPWTALSDFDYSANKLGGAAAGWSFAFPVNQFTSIVGVCVAGGVSVPPWCLPNGHNNFRMYDNLATGMSDERDYYGGTVPNGYGFVTSENHGSFNVDFRHNTFLMATSGVSGYMSNMVRFETTATGAGYNNIRDNIIPTSGSPINWPGGGGECSWRTGLAANGTANLRGNTLINQGQWGTYSFTTGTACSGSNVFPAGTQTASSNAAAVDGVFRAQPAIQNTASDGRDPGANIDRVNYATAGAVSGAYNAALEYKLRGVMPTRTGTKIYFTAPSVNGCTWELSTNPDSFASPIAVTSQTRNGRDGIATWTANLSAATAYFARATCDTFKLEHDIAGRRFMFVTAP